MLLPAIGAMRAKGIIEYRQTVGKIRNSNDLEKIHGIGAKTARRLDKFLAYK